MLGLGLALYFIFHYRYTSNSQNNVAHTDLYTGCGLSVLCGLELMNGHRIQCMMNLDKSSYI